MCSQSGKTNYQLIIVFLPGSLAERKVTVSFLSFIKVMLVIYYKLLLAGFYVPSRWYLFVKYGKARLLWKSCGMEGIEWGRERSLHLLHVHQLVFCVTLRPERSSRNNTDRTNPYSVFLKSVQMLCSNEHDATMASGAQSFAAILFVWPHFSVALLFLFCFILYLWMSKLISTPKHGILSALLNVKESHIIA